MQCGKTVELRLEQMSSALAVNDHVAKLRQGVDNSRNSIQACKESIKSIKMGIVEGELAQVDLCRQYENNYLDARKKFGRHAAERLSPKLSNSPKNEIDTGTDGQQLSQ